MSLVARFINNVDAILVCQFKIFYNRGIVRSPDTVYVKPFEYLHILSDRGFVHYMTCNGMLHMAVDAVQLYRLAIEIEYLIPYFCFLETNPTRHCFCNPFRINKLKSQFVEVWLFGRP